jgi:hypothetical protein
MDTREKLISARVGMRVLANELQNISRACQAAGISRSHLYEIRTTFEKCGRDGLAPAVPRRPRMPNESPVDLVQRILQMTLDFPTFSHVRISHHLRLIGVPASLTQVHGVWQREGLLKRFDRLMWLEKQSAATGGPPKDQVKKPLAKHQRETPDRQSHREAPYPGYLGRIDTYFVRTLNGIGRIYAKNLIDASIAVAFSKL